MYTALTAAIVNLPNDDPPVASLRRVVAQINLKSPQDPDVVANRGAWLDEEFNSTDFPVSAVRWLIIALKDSSGMVYTVEDHKESAARLRGPTFREVMRGTYDVEVKLIHIVNGRTVSSFRLRLSPDPYRLWSVAD